MRMPMGGGLALAAPAGCTGDGLVHAEVSRAVIRHVAGLVTPTLAGARLRKASSVALLCGFTLDTQRVQHVVPRMAARRANTWRTTRSELPCYPTSLITDLRADQGFSPSRGLHGLSLPRLSVCLYGDGARSALRWRRATHL